MELAVLQASINISRHVCVHVDVSAGNGSSQAAELPWHDVTVFRRLSIRGLRHAT